ncbi:hypothetical protein SDC9_51328 [bioreactor metagenome]|uniref:Pesticidal crystal protein Cry22Aa Ig-like domain-containing protein n=1 Tax=bioreactor metagenome TaxID=1076179 RepID=A0A644WN53_9ZZZZ
MKHQESKKTLSPKKSFFVCFFIISSILFFGCKKDDEPDDINNNNNVTTDITNPTITINGSAAVVLDLGDNYTDSGATANDNHDGDLTSEITTNGTVDVNKVDIYEIVYTVSDSAGNTTTKTRTVTVRDNRLAGTYSVHAIITGAAPGSYNFTEVVTATVDYNKINFDDFCGFTGLMANATVNGSGISFNQTISYDWDADGTPTNGTISGSSLPAFSVSAGATPIAAITTLTYTIDYGSGQVDNVSATYTKQ